jgi:hypothetical protein
VCCTFWNHNNGVAVAWNCNNDVASFVDLFCIKMSVQRNNKFYGRHAIIIVKWHRRCELYLGAKIEQLYGRYVLERKG